MDKHQELFNAVWVLRRWRDWSTGCDCRTFEGAGLDGGVLGDAVDCLLAEWCMQLPAIECSQCQHASTGEDGRRVCALGVKGECMQFKPLDA